MIRVSAVGRTGPWALPVSEEQDVVCFDCDRGGTGDLHHLGGRPSPLPPIRISVAHHRLLTHLQWASWVGRVPAGHPLAVSFDLAALYVVLLVG